jgi:hypothetical protein
MHSLNVSETLKIPGQRRDSAGRYPLRHIVTIWYEDVVRMFALSWPYRLQIPHFESLTRP